MTQKIVMYSKPVCPYCDRAKVLLEKHKVKFDVIDISSSPELLEEMKKLSGGRQTVPQIFIGKHHVGGCDDLYAAEASGTLKELLK